MSPRRKTEAPPNLPQRWRMALNHAGMTHVEWARERNLSPSHVRHVVHGRPSERLLIEILAFVTARERLIAEELDVRALDAGRNSRPAASAA